MRNKRSIATLIGIVIASLLVRNTSFFLINNLEVKKANADCVQDTSLIKDLNIIGKNIFTTSVDQASILNRYPCIESLNLQKSRLNKVIISVEGRKPLVRVASLGLSIDLKEATPSSQTALLDWSQPLATDTSYLVADDNGVIFTATQSTSSAIIYLADEKLILGKRLSSDMFHKIAAVLKLLDSLGERVSFGKVINEALLIKGNEKIVFSLDNIKNRQVASLQLILGKAKIDGRPIEMIDLRFDKPVVVYYGKH